MPITACDLMHDRVLPFYENLVITVGAVLTGRTFRLAGSKEGVASPADRLDVVGPRQVRRHGPQGREKSGSG